MTGSTDPALRPLDAQEEALLRALERVMNLLRRRVDADMIREQHLPVTEYVALMRLSETQDRQMRMSELATVCDLSLSGMTRVVMRLEQEGLVRRVRCAEDARGWNATLTDAGYTRLQQAWPTNLASVRRHLIAHLERADVERMAVALGRVAAALSDF